MAVIEQIREIEDVLLQEGVNIQTSSVSLSPAGMESIDSTAETNFISAASTMLEFGHPANGHQG